MLCFRGRPPVQLSGWSGQAGNATGVVAPANSRESGNAEERIVEENRTEIPNQNVNVATSLTLHLRMNLVREFA